MLVNKLTREIYIKKTANTQCLLLTDTSRDQYIREEEAEREGKLRPTICLLRKLPFFFPHTKRGGFLYWDVEFGQLKK